MFVPVASNTLLFNYLNGRHFGGQKCGGVAQNSSQNSSQNNILFATCEQDLKQAFVMTLLSSIYSIDREGDVRGNFDQVTKRVIIGYDGNMTWLSNVLIMSKCPMNIRYFPFDTQECVLKFSSWVYDGAQLDLELNRIDVDLGTVGVFCCLNGFRWITF